MANYKHYNVEIVIEEGSYLDRTLEKLSRAAGMPEKIMVANAVGIGVYAHMEQNLNLLRRCYLREENETKPLGPVT